MYCPDYDEHGGILHVMNKERLNWLETQLPGLRKKTLCVFDYLLFGNTVRHKVYRDALLVTDKMLQGVGSGIKAFKRNNQQLDLLYTNGEFSKAAGVVQPWWYTDKAIKIIADYYSTEDFVERAMRNTTEYKLRLDIAGLGRALEQGKISPQNIPEAFKLIKAVADNPECLSRYKRAECGRLFTQMGDYSLQRMPKELRKWVMKGWYAYDITNCHIAIASTYGDFPMFKQYAEDTYGFRGVLSFELGVDIDKVKTALLALLYGAGEGALRDILGDTWESFVDHDLVELYIQDCKVLKPLVLSEAKRLGFTKGTTSSKMSKVIMKKESEILDICVYGVYKPVLLFDGWITPKKMENLKEIERNVLTKTGICVTVTENEI